MQLNQEHAEIRFSAFQIVDELFTRSHQFRTLIISNFQEFLELTVETDYEQPLPPPYEVAQKLKKTAIKSIQEWYEKYGEAYKKLSLGHHFLKQNKKVFTYLLFHDLMLCDLQHKPMPAYLKVSPVMFCDSSLGFNLCISLVMKEGV